MAAHTFTFHNVHAKRSSACSGHKMKMLMGAYNREGLMNVVLLTLAIIWKEHCIRFSITANTKKAHAELEENDG